MKIETMNIEDVVPYARNAKQHPAWQVDQIAASIEEFGNNDPIAIDNENVVIEGHGRLLALKQLGYNKVEVIRLGHLSDEQKRAYILAHNKLTMNTDFDLQTLDFELQSIESIDMTDFGFEQLGSLDDEVDDVTEDDFDEDEEVETRCKRGEIWKLGDHYLMCGDSTSREDIEALMTAGEVLPR